MKILHITPEIAPWSKAGGLGDATSALAKNLAALGHEVRVASPLYGSVPGREKMGTLLDSLKVDVGGDPAKAACRVRSLELAPKAQVWFIEHEDYYGAREIYPAREDTAERAAFFGRASLDACLQTGWIPDVIHCHDWTTGLVPVLLNTTLKASPLGRCASVLSIHNLQHQGLLSRRILPFLRLPEWLFKPEELECLGGVNFLKGGILHATRVLTVSPTYAQEILTPAFGFGLQDVVQRRQANLDGILNGVDLDEWDARKDKHLAQTFSAQDLSGKRTCKQDLQKEFKLAQADVPLVGVISRLWDQKGLDLAVQVLPKFLRSDRLQFVLLGSGDSWLEQEYRRLADNFPGRAGVRIGYDHALSHRIEAGCDFFLMPSRFEPCGLNQMYSMAYGTLPIVRATGGLADTVRHWNPSARQGTGIVFQHADVGAVDWAIEQALALYARPADFVSAQKQAMQAEFSWLKSAQAHLVCYGKAIQQH